jgi:hypothetical protein
MISGIKMYLYSALALLVAGLGIAVKVLTTKNSRLSREVEMADAKIHHAKVVEQKKQETTTELRSRRATLIKELKEKKTSSELEDPNEW